MKKYIVVAGLGLAMSMGVYAPAIAETGVQDTPAEGEYANPSYEGQVTGESTGETKLYIKSAQDDISTSEGSQDEQMKVSIPVAIHYVANEDGTLVGPTDNTVKFVNHTKLGAVHVSKIRVTNSGNTSIVKNAKVKNNDEVSFFVQPAQGQSDDAGTSFRRGVADEGNNDSFAQDGSLDEFGAYVSESKAINPTHRNQWNIAQKNGALALNNLTGKIGGFGAMSPATDYQAGVVHWTVRSGTRADADLHDASVTIHYHPNTGSNKNGTPIPDQETKVADTASLPDKVEIEGALNTKLSSGATLLDPPVSTTNADGTVTSWQFKEWNTKADGQGKTIATVGDLGTVSDIAGKTFEVYAIFAETTA
ncbi:MAG: hypothetical protein Q4B54_04135 [Coriobacteriales bacterium]|nr:hypothetical protein [Coriobacteriales bacterium]